VSDQQPSNVTTPLSQVIIYIPSTGFCAPRHGNPTGRVRFFWFHDKSTHNRISFPFPPFKKGRQQFGVYCRLSVVTHAVFRVGQGCPFNGRRVFLNPLPLSRFPSPLPLVKVPPLVYGVPIVAISLFGFFFFHSGSGILPVQTNPCTRMPYVLFLVRAGTPQAPSLFAPPCAS